MTRFSKATIQKLKVHLEKLKNSTNHCKENTNEIKDKKFYQSNVFPKNQNVAKALLIESVFLNLQILNLNRSSGLIKFLLKNKKTFVGNELINSSYLTVNITKIKSNRLNSLLFFLLKNSNEKSKLVSKKLKTTSTIITRKLNAYYELIKKSINRWYIYVNRCLVLSLIHFIPFIQLSTKVFYTYPNPIIANPVTSYLFHIFPLLLRLINSAGAIIANETFSFLLIGFYYKIFIISYKKYKIPRKIAFQGTFAIALMLLNYCVIMSSEITNVLYKFAKRLFFFTKYQDIDLLRDDINFYVDDLEELRYFKETFLQWGESIFSLNDLTKAIKISESTTIISLLGVIALLYNYVYFIIRGEKPIIPLVTKTVRRMMVDRNGDEF